jgi:hypothetical protein
LGFCGVLCDIRTYFDCLRVRETGWWGRISTLSESAINQTLPEVASGRAGGCFEPGNQVFFPEGKRQKCCTSKLTDFIYLLCGLKPRF